MKKASTHHWTEKIEIWAVLSPFTRSKRGQVSALLFGNPVILAVLGIIAVVAIGLLLGFTVFLALNVFIAIGAFLVIIGGLMLLRGALPTISLWMIGLGIAILLLPVISDSFSGISLAAVLS